MADNSSSPKPPAADLHEVDSVMADETPEMLQPTASPAERAASPSQSMASPGMFVGQSTKPNTPAPAPEAPMTGDAAIQAMLDYQRQAAQKFLERKAENHAPSPTPAGITDDGVSEILQRRKDIVDDDQAKDFEKHKARYLEKQKAGNVSMEAEIQFLRLESAENTRQRKILQDAELDNPTGESDGGGDDLFVGLDEVLYEVPSLRSDSDGEADDQPKKRGRKRKNAAASEQDDQPAKKRGKKAGPKSRKVPGHNYSEADLDAVMASSRKSKKTERASKASKPSKTSKYKAQPKKAAKPGPSMTDTSNLRGTDIFRDTAANEHLPDQPTFENATRRQDAMKQLITGVPMEGRDMAKYDKKALDDAIKEFNGHGSVKPAPDGNWLLRGLRTTLKHYQILGVAFMRKRENGTEQPRGGIMADGMGLGKTVMTLANVINGKPPGKKKVLRTTLIVASPALVNQWYQEIEKHCVTRKEHKEAGLGGVYQHRAGHRLDSNKDMETLEQADIILTTYSEVNRSYPRAEPPQELTTAKEKDEWWKVYYEENKGILHKLKFLRVVLDEAQQIKNHRSLGSLACRSLSARHYWALTGTPIYNSVSEFYSLFKFLREPHTGSFKIFKANFCDSTDPDSLEKLNVFLRKLMVRRTHRDTLFGAKLLDLPKPHQKTVTLEFSSTERQIYEIVKNRMVNRINSIAKTEGNAGLQKKFSHVWAMILRLRQLCGHILLIQGTILDILEREDFEKLNRLATSEEDVSDDGAALLVHLRHALSARNNLENVDGTTGASLSETQIIATGTVDIADINGDVGGHHGISFKFKRYLKALAKSDRWTEVTDRSCCVACRQKAHNPYISDCWHIYCFSCLTDMQHHAARRGMDSMRCAECGEQYSNAQPCEGLEHLAEEVSASPTDTQITGVTGKKRKDSNEEDWINMPGDILPSAKTRATKMQILLWLEEEPEAKIIIYTQFIPMIKILEKMCRTERWECCKYTGNMSHDNRASAIKEFAAKPEKKILLASLKAGGLGLNLTMASRVILIDPWWNSAVEQQAFARIHRIGQIYETRLTRLVVTNTIDAAMMDIKERKDKDIDAVMNDDRRKESLTVTDLMRLFGPVKEGEDGKPFIFAQGADNIDEGEEHLRFAQEDSDDEEAFMGNEE